MPCPSFASHLRCPRNPSPSAAVSRPLSVTGPWKPPASQRWIPTSCTAHPPFSQFICCKRACVPCHVENGRRRMPGMECQPVKRSPHYCPSPSLGNGHFVVLFSHVFFMMFHMWLWFRCSWFSRMGTGTQSTPSSFNPQKVRYCCILSGAIMAKKGHLRR
jgi:hypothetical protein